MAGKRRAPWMLIALILASPSPGRAAQIKPPESSSKIKRVLLYQKVGGWVITEGIKEFQVIVWNNNTDAGSSVRSRPARQAVLDCLNGGGWLLIHGTAIGPETWPGPAQAMGASYHMRTLPDEAELVLDEDAKKHKELKCLLLLRGGVKASLDRSGRIAVHRRIAL